MRRSISVVMVGSPEVVCGDPREPEQLGVKPCWRSNSMNTGVASTSAKDRDDSWYKDRVIFRLPRRLSHSNFVPTPPDVCNWLKGRLPEGVGYPAMAAERSADQAWDYRYGQHSGLGRPRPLPQRRNREAERQTEALQAAQFAAMRGLLPAAATAGGALASVFLKEPVSPMAGLAISLFGVRAIGAVEDSLKPEETNPTVRALFDGARMLLGAPPPVQAYESVGVPANPRWREDAKAELDKLKVSLRRAADRGVQP